MKFLTSFLNKIPSLTGSPEPAVYGTLIAAIVALVPALSLHLSSSQVTALSTIVTILFGFLIRQHVSPVVPQS